MSQIEDFETPYNIVFGDDGGDAQIIPGPGGKDFPIWRARNFVVAILKAQMEKTDDPDERREFDKIRNQFRFAETGDMVFGMIRRFKNRKGKKRFIGVTPKGVDYREAGRVPQPVEPKNLPPLPRDDHRLRTGANLDGTQGRGRQKPKPQPSEAERIAGKMAQAARKAVEDE